MIALLVSLALVQEAPVQGVSPNHDRAGCESAANGPDRCASRAVPDPARQAVAPKPRFAPGGLVTLADYPAAALEQGQSGTVIMRLTVSPQGRVARCDIAHTSGYALLDQATCDLVTARARFDPARDISDRAIESFATLPINWRLEE